jgi:hypothetical protein
LKSTGRASAPVIQRVRHYKLRRTGGDKIIVNKSQRILYSWLAAILSLPLIVWLLSEVVVFYEMLTTGASSRRELGDDLGLGILLFMVVPIGTIIGAIGVWIAVWIHTGRKVNHRDRK